MILKDCSKCRYESTCLINDKNKAQSKLIKVTEMENALKMLREFNRAGINYKINTNGRIDFQTVAEKERAIEIIQEMQKL